MTGQSELSRFRSVLVLLLLAAVNFGIVLDVTILNVALPSIRADFGANDAALQWLVLGYILAYALGLLPFGRAGDRFGPRPVLLIGLTLFASTSLLCGFAPSTQVLLAGRILQGAGAALISPQAMAMAHRMFQGKSRATAFAEGVQASEAGVASAILQALQQVAGALGVALTSSAFFSALSGTAASDWRHALSSALRVTVLFFAAFLVLILALWCRKITTPPCPMKE
jgi:MFS family permease